MLDHPAKGERELSLETCQLKTQQSRSHTTMCERRLNLMHFIIAKPSLIAVFRLGATYYTDRKAQARDSQQAKTSERSRHIAQKDALVYHSHMAQTCYTFQKPYMFESARITTDGDLITSLQSLNALTYTSVTDITYVTSSQWPASITLRHDSKMDWCMCPRKYQRKKTQHKARDAVEGKR